MHSNVGAWHSTHHSACCFQWQIDLGCSPAPLFSQRGLCSQVLSTETFLTFLRKNDKSLQMLLETSMGMVGTQTPLPQSPWNFWRSLKSSVNYCSLKQCRKFWGKHQKGSVSMNLGQSWLKQFSMWEYTRPYNRTGVLWMGQEWNSLIAPMPVADLY